MEKLKAKKIMALLLSAMMVFSLVGCGSTKAETATTEATTDTAATTETVAAPASIDFEDGLFGFVSMDQTAGNADASVLSVEDYNGSKALKVTTQGKTPYLLIAVDSLLGDNLANLKSVQMDIGTENPDGTFYATSGNFYVFSGADSSTKSAQGWSVYLADKDPVTKSFTLADTEVLQAGNYILVSLEVDNGLDKGAAQANMYIDNISFLDKDGNVLTADTAAVYTPPVAANIWEGLTEVSNETAIDGFAVSADGWAQAGVNTTLNGGTFDATTITPGSIVTIYYTSESKEAENMWLVGVSTEANTNGTWLRICGSQQDGTAAYNADQTMCQISYDQIVSVLGEDFATSLTGLQCESDGKWEVYKVTVGTPVVPLYNVANDTPIEGFAVKADGWAQAGIDTTLNGGTFDASTIVPGSVLTIKYTSESKEPENMWLVGVSTEENPNGTWLRICGSQQDGTAVYNSDQTVCQITYDQIVAVLGEDFASTLTALQCESDGKWEVYSVSIGTIVPGYKEALNQTEIEGFAVSADGWAQAGVDTTLNAGTFDASTITPGSVLTISYTSESVEPENMWLVGVSTEDNPNGTWLRICGSQQDGTAVYNDKLTKCQITYDQIVSVLGEDFAKTLTALQCESDGKWEVYSVTIGTPAE